MANISSRYRLGFCGLAHIAIKAVGMEYDGGVCICLPGTQVLKYTKFRLFNDNNFAYHRARTWKCTFAKVSVEICKQMGLVALIYSKYISRAKSERGSCSYLLLLLYVKWLHSIWWLVVCEVVSIRSYNVLPVSNITKYHMLLNQAHTNIFILSMFF